MSETTLLNDAREEIEHLRAELAEARGLLARMRDTAAAFWQERDMECPGSEACDNLCVAMNEVGLFLDPRRAEYEPEDPRPLLTKVREERGAIASTLPRDEARRCTCAVIGVEYRASTGERIGELHLPWCPARDEGKP